MNWWVAQSEVLVRALSLTMSMAGACDSLDFVNWLEELFRCERQSVFCSEIVTVSDAKELSFV